jgi:hypothetical protein
MLTEMSPASRIGDFHGGIVPLRPAMGKVLTSAAAHKFGCGPGGLFAFFRGFDLLLLLGGRLLFGRGLKLHRVCGFDL